MSKNYLFLALIGILSFQHSTAQDVDYVFENKVYVENIHTIEFGPAGFSHLFPMTILGENSPLLLSFDDFSDDVKDYVYTFVHCNQNWTPSSLSPLEYIDGFEEEDIREYDFSFQTFQNYTHYELMLPNNSIRWTKTGNYLLVVYEDEYDKIPVITRRFVVASRNVGVNAQVVRPAQVSKMRTHQEIDFEVDYQQLDVRNPKMELRASIIQNGRWDNAITALAPKFIRADVAVYDYQDKIVFWGGNEFRVIDIRSINSPQSEVESISVYNEQEIEVVMAPVFSRARGAHLSFEDLNGGFAIDNFDQRRAEVSSEYPIIYYKYETETIFIEDHLYLFGAITDWELQPEFKLVYNPAVSAYMGRFPLKQGYYNYLIATAPSDTEDLTKETPNFSKTEGNFSDTENDYQILIYYRPFGSRYDQVVGAYQLNSMR